MKTLYTKWKKTFDNYVTRASYIIINQEKKRTTNKLTFKKRHYETQSSQRNKCGWLQNISGIQTKSSLKFELNTVKNDHYKDTNDNKYCVRCRNKKRKNKIFTHCGGEYKLVPLFWKSE